MPCPPPTLHDLSKNADNHPAALLKFAAVQHAAPQIQRKFRRLCGAMLSP
jgi:hypothetical protein